MKKLESPVRIFHTALTAVNLGCVFYGLMICFGKVNILYRFFRFISLLPVFMFPTYLLRGFDLAYVLFSLLAVWSVALYIYKLISRTVTKKMLVYDAVIWLVSVSELLFLEDYFVNLRYW